MKTLFLLAAALMAAFLHAVPASAESFRVEMRNRGEKGSMQDEFLVHTREGEECPRCGGRINRIVVSGRSTYFCPECQVRLRRRRRRKRVPKR